MTSEPGRDDYYAPTGADPARDREIQLAAEQARDERWAAREAANEERRRQHPEVAAREDAMARYRRGEPARNDEERDLRREWAELDADVVQAVAEADREDADREAGQ